MNTSFKVGDDPANVRANRRRLFEQVNITEEKLAIPQQVHGARVQFAPRPGLYERTDALVTSHLDVYLFVTIADCIPLFLFDPASRSVAAIHAGWRGCAEGIVREAVIRTCSDCSAIPESMLAFVGPSARSCCYEVGAEVAELFDARFLSHGATGRMHLDMVSHSVSLLLSAGLREPNIEVSPYCTICNPRLFHSYRRDREKSGRTMALIGLANR
jgi:hypothetical protein